MKRKVTFSVEDAVLFDALHKMKGDTGPLGERLVAVMLTGSVTLKECGMALYGVAVTNVENIK